MKQLYNKDAIIKIAADPVGENEIKRISFILNKNQVRLFGDYAQAVIAGEKINFGYFDIHKVKNKESDKKDFYIITLAKTNNYERHLKVSDNVLNFAGIVDFLIRVKKNFKISLFNKESKENKIIVDFNKKMI